MAFFSRIETKVYAATGGGFFGGTLSTAVLWALGVYAWGAPNDAAHNDAAVSAVPVAIAALIPPVCGALGALTGGWVAAPSNHAGNDPAIFALDYGPATNDEVGDEGHVEAIDDQATLGEAGAA